MHDHCNNHQRLVFILEVKQSPPGLAPKKLSVLQSEILHGYIYIPLLLYFIYFFSIVTWLFLSEDGACSYFSLSSSATCGENKIIRPKIIAADAGRARQARSDEDARVEREVRGGQV